ncbi:hypothetical protein GQ457_11G026200 [Hibiscus cannabinus]
MQLNEADTPSTSSSKLRSALLAQLNLNNPEVAETYPTQWRVSYGHVDSMWGVLPFLYACARHVMASGACAMHTGQHVQRMCIITHAKLVAGFKQPFPSCFRRLTLQMSGCQCKPPKREVIGIQIKTSDEPGGQPPSLQVQAIIRELKKSFREELEPIHDRLERLERSQTNAPEEDHRQTDPDTYLAWGSKVEHIFECYNYSEQKKVRFAAMEFVDYALIWWDQLLLSRRHTGEGPGLKQGNRSVEDYFKEMEMAMMRANIEGDREATMTHFLNGLNTDIANVVELQHYIELDEMVHMAIKVQRQQRRKSSNRGNTPFKSSSNSLYTPNLSRKQAPLQIREEAESSKSKPPVADNGRGKQVVMQECSRDIQCFKCLGRGHVASQCPNRRIVLLRENVIRDSL